jgi:hypothetical protein
VPTPTNPTAIVEMRRRYVGGFACSVFADIVVFTVSLSMLTAGVLEGPT